jgi:hypothetical protein
MGNKEVITERGILLWDEIGARTRDHHSLLERGRLVKVVNICEGNPGNSVPLNSMQYLDNF